MDAVSHYRRVAFRRFLTYWRDALPGVPYRRRMQAVDLVMITVEAVANRVAENGTLHDGADAYARAVGDMLCTYLAQLNEGKAVTTVPELGS